MAPVFYISANTLTPYDSQYTGTYSTGYIQSNPKVETKKEKTNRIAKEKMLASWKVFDQKTPTVIKIKQLCKPRYKINFSGRRF